MSNYKYKFTFFTPCFNSARFIHRVFRTLDSQTYRNFEWIVINDASEDNTSELITNYIKDVDFKVKFFDLKKNQMLAANYNLAIENAEGEYFFLHDHDDEFIPTVLEHYVELIDKYDNDNIGGIVGRCQTQYGKITPAEFTKPIMNYWEYGVDKNGNYTGEAPRVIKLDVIKRYFPFDPEEKLNPPIEPLMGCDGFDFITTNQIVRNYYVNENETALTKTVGKYTLHNWRNALLSINKFQLYTHWSKAKKIKSIVYYCYCTIRLKKGFLKGLDSLERDKFFFVLCYPIGLVLNVIADNPFLHRMVLRIKNGF